MNSDSKTTLEKLRELLNHNGFICLSSVFAQGQTEIETVEKIFIIIQMPCGCAVGTHPPGEHLHPASNCPIQVY